MPRKLTPALVAVACLAVSTSCARAAEPAQTLKVALVQLGREPTMKENRDKIVRLTREAAAGGSGTPEVRCPENGFDRRCPL